MGGKAFRFILAVFLSLLFVIPAGIGGALAETVAVQQASGVIEESILRNTGAGEITPDASVISDPPLTIQDGVGGILNSEQFDSDRASTQNLDLQVVDSSEEALFLVAPKEVHTYSMPPSEVWVSVLLVATKESVHLISLSAELKGKVVCTNSLDVALSSSGLNRESLLQILSSDAEPEMGKIGFPYIIKIPLQNIQIAEGETVPLKVRVVCEGANPIESVIKYTPLAFPQSSGWYVGDTHVHSLFSDGIDTTTYLANYAKDNGFNFVVMTDHVETMSLGKTLYPPSWGNYVSQCTANSNPQFRILPGAEYAVSSPNGHCLAYNLSTSADSIPLDNTYTPQALVDKIRNHNPPNSFAIVAHPNNFFYPWPALDVKGIEGWQLMNGGEDKPPEETLSSWFLLLNSGLETTLNSGNLNKFVVGIGGSDFHGEVWQHLGEACTYIYSPSGLPDNSTVWNQIRKGCVSASAKGDLGFFTIDEMPQGSVIESNAGDTLTFAITQKPLDSTCTGIFIVDKDYEPILNNFIKEIPNPSSTTINEWLLTPASNTFYTVFFEFTDFIGRKRQVWTNPIFVKVNSGNNPPNPPTTSVPANGAGNRPVNQTLNWTPGGDPDGDAVTYDVYFGTGNPPTTKVSTSQSGTSYDPPGDLNYATTYYWKVVAKDSRGAVTSGSPWNFTTAGANNPSPGLEAYFPQIAVVNQPITMTFDLGNVGGTAEHGGISISFPELDAVSSASMQPYTSNKGDVSASSPDGLNVQLYDHGKLISPYPPGSTKIAAQHLLVEGDYGSWGNQVTKFLNITFTPKIAGIYHVQARGWLTTNGFLNYFGFPSSGSSDQQGYPTFDWTIQVSDSAKTFSFLDVQPSNWSFTAVGATQQFQATAFFSDGSSQTITNDPGCTWVSSNNSSATVSANGLVTSVAGGSANITASYTFNGMSKSDSAIVTVGGSQTLTSLEMIPSSWVFNTSGGVPLQLHVTAHFSDGSSREVTSQATYISNNPAVANVNTQAQAWGVSNGSTSIQASLTDSSGNTCNAFCQVSVVLAKTLQSLDLSPLSIAFTAAGETTQLLATAHYTDGTSADVTNVSNWSSENTGIVSVTNQGLARAETGGSTLIKLTYASNGVEILKFCQVMVSIQTPLVSGRVSRAGDSNGLDGVRVTFSSGASRVTAGGGYYSQQLGSGWSGTIAPSYSGGGAFSPSQHQYPQDANYDFVWIPPTNPVISGRVLRSDNGAGVAGVNLSFSDGANQVSVEGGYFAKEVASGWTGTLTPSSPLGGSFSPMQHQYPQDGSYNFTWSAPPPQRRWMPVNNGLWSGDVNALAVDSLQNNVIFAATNNGVFKSTDFANNWTSKSAGLANLTVRALVLHPQQLNRLYAATEGGIYQSTDGGEVWIATLTGESFLSLSIHPSTPSILYAGAASGKVFRSINSGADWTLTSTVVADCPAINALAINPATPSIVFAGSRGKGLFRSDNGGQSWTTSSSGMTGSSIQLNSLLILPQTPSIMFAGSYGFGNGAIYKSTDGGANWASKGSGLLWDGWGTTYALTVDPNNPTTLYAGRTCISLNSEGLDGSGVFKSTDSGERWSSRISGLTTPWVMSLVIDPLSSSTLYAGTAGGVYKSTYSGGQWLASSIGLSAPMALTLVINPNNPATLFVGTYGGGIFKTTNSCSSWSFISQGFNSQSINDIHLDPQFPDTIYAATGGNFYKSTNSGGGWNSSTSGLKGTWTVAVDKQNTNNLYAYGFLPTSTGGNQRIVKSTDGGMNWNLSGTGFGANYPFGFGYNSATDLVVNPQNPSIVYAAAGDMPDANPPIGGVFRSLDGGANWSCCNTGVGVERGWCLAVDPSDGSIVYLGTESGKVFRSTNSGASWTKTATLPIPSSARIAAIALDPWEPSILYAATGVGVFRSSDGGNSWQAINAGLNNLSVYSLAIDSNDPNTLYAATLGGGVYKYTTDYPPARYSLSVTADPPNGGAVNCNPTPEADGKYVDGATVALTASPSYGYLFDHWDGSASGSTTPTTIILSADGQATAHFVPAASPVIFGRVARQSDGQGMDEVTVNFSNGGGSLLTSGGGYYVKQVPYGWSGTVTPTSTNGGAFYPVSRSYPALAGNQSNNDYIWSSPSGDLSITFSLQGAATSYTATFAVAFYNPGGTSPLFSQTVTIPALAGSFTLAGVTPGTYDIKIKESRALSTLRTGVVLVTGTTTVDFSEQRVGDANNDNVVNITDFSLLKASFGKSTGQAGYDRRAEFDGNGVVNITDFVLMKSNFGRWGPL